MTGYFPSPGDVVVFPGAKSAVNRTRRYVVTGWLGNQVTFAVEGYSEEFCHHVCDLWGIGMTKADSGEVAVPDAIEGALAPEDLVRANMRAAGFPVGSAADARAIRAGAEQWAQDFAAASRAEDGIPLGPENEADR